MTVIRYVPKDDTIRIIQGDLSITVPYWDLDRAYWSAREEHIERTNKDISR